MKNKFPKIFLLAVIGILVFPQVSFAAWWNPFTWFKKSVPTQQVPEKLTPTVEELSKKIDTLQKEVDASKTKSSSASKVVETKPAQKPVQQVSVTPRKRLANKEIIAKIKPAVVYITTANGSGSGIIIDASGHILTNAHVISGASSVEVRLSDTRSFVATILGRDEQIDLAVLKVDAVNLPFAKFGDSDSVEQGDEVFTLGYPFGLEGDVSFKEGTISRMLVESGASYLETSAEIHPGNSGGPLVNIFAEVIGVNTAALGRGIGGITLGETIKLAIPTNSANAIIPSLKSGRVVLVPQESKSSTNTNICPMLKQEADALAITLREVSSLITDIDKDFDDDGMKENPATGTSLNFDYPYNKFSAKRESFYRRVDELSARIIGVNSTLSVSSLLSDARLAFSRGTGAFREAFEQKLAAFKYLTSDARVYFNNGSSFFPRSEIDNAKATLFNSIDRAKDAKISFLDGTYALKKIQLQYKDALSKNNCQ